MGMMGSRRVLLGARETLPAPALDYNYVSSQALGGAETFTRASTAWSFNSSGVLTSAATNAARFDYDPSTARTNLALRSAQQDVSGVWTASQITVTADTVTDPSTGGTNADTFTENSGSTSRGTSQNISIATNVTQTFSIYAKAGTRSWVRLMLNTGPDSVIGWFNLGSGVVGSTQTEGTGASPTVAISNAGNGWYRCVLSGIPASANSGTISAYIRMATADNEFSYQGNGAGTLHVWGAQLELGSSATAYIATAASAVTSCTARGLLLEEARTNLLLRSAEFDNASWSKTASSVTANAVAAPDGTTTADKLVEDTTAAAEHFIRQFPTTVGAYTLSVFAKADTRTWLTLDTFNATDGARVANFNLGSGVVGTVSGGTTATIVSVSGGWYRVTFTFTSAATGDVKIKLHNGTTTVYTGNGTSGLYLWGAQLEAGSFVTSHVPTTTVSVTRAVDVCSIPASSIPSFSATEGTLYAAFLPLGVSGTQTAVYLDDGTSNERLGIRASSAALAGVVVDGGVSQAAVSGGTLTAAATKAALAYRLDDIALSVNGGAVATDTSATLPTVTTLLIGTRLTGSESLSGWYTRVSYYNRRIADRFLAQITT